jgi:hypothetical protein
MTNYEKYYDQKRMINLPNGDIYEGTLNGKLKHGYGIYRFAKGDIYEGEWENDLQQGNGVLQYTDGSVYEG